MFYRQNYIIFCTTNEEIFIASSEITTLQGSSANITILFEYYMVNFILTIAHSAHNERIYKLHKITVIKLQDFVHLCNLFNSLT